MVVFSTLRSKFLPAISLVQTQKPSAIIGTMIKRQMAGHGPRKMTIETSDFAFLKFVNMVHTYSYVAALIYGSIILYCNVFIGDPELREIPEGYVPKYWEYFDHPITRFIAWFQDNPQKFYENFLHHLHQEHWDLKLTELEDKVKFEMKKHKDYKAYYYQAISGNTLRYYIEENKFMPERLGQNPVILESFPTDFKDDDDWPGKLPSD